MSELQITGKITKVLGSIDGTSKAGKDWVKQSFIVTTTEDYNNVYCFEIFGEEKVLQFNNFNKEGDNVTVKFNVSCNEWEGKYFTSLNAWRVESEMKTEEGAPLEMKNDLPF